MPRYNDVAVLLHWSIALLIVGLLAVGKFMVSLDDTDPLRFTLTQWHKSFGLCVLALSVVRLSWRWRHGAPPPPDTLPRVQSVAASAVHLALYGLMFALPITGWIMVSASPLNIDTVWFNAVTVPHLPPFDTLANRADIAETLAFAHHQASHLLIVLLVMHSGAAVKHHLIDRDDVLRRMSPDLASASFRRTAAVAAGAVALLVGVLLLPERATVLRAGSSAVGFVATVGGDAVEGDFVDSDVTASLDLADLANSRIDARLRTGSVRSANPQVEGALPDPDWFDAAQFPEAHFASTAITQTDSGALQVTGDVTIKGRTRTVSFTLTLSDDATGRAAFGEFTVDRRDFAIGLGSQPDDGMVGYPVTVRFRFEIGATSDDVAQAPDA